MKITLNTPKEKIVVQEVKKSISTLTVQRIVDLPEKKEVRAFLVRVPCPNGKCDGEMRYHYGSKRIKDNWFQKHYCRRCGLIQYYSKKYPYFEHEDIKSGAKISL